MFELADPDKPSLLDRKEANVGSTVDIGHAEPFGQRVPRQRVFIRESYVELFALVWVAFLQGEGRVTVTVTGTPGIGKSVYGLMFLVELIRYLRRHEAARDKLVSFGPHQLDGRIVYEHRVTDADKTTFYLVDTAAQSIEQASEMPQGWVVSSAVFLLKDGACQQFDVSCPVLWVSSPRLGSFQKVQRDAIRRLILAPWTADELVAYWKADCASLRLFELSALDQDRRAREAMLSVRESSLNSGVKEDEVVKELIVRRWAADLGPVARRVFNPALAYERLQGAMNDLSTEDLGAVISIARGGRDLSATSRFKQSHRLLLMVPSADCTGYAFVPSSVRIGRTLTERSLAASLRLAESLLGQVHGVHKGLMFEPYAHFVLARGGQWKIRNLVTDNLNEFTLRSLATVEVANSEVASMCLEAGKYYTPADPQFPVVDSWTTQAMFQITVSSHHPIKSGAALYRALRGKGPNKLIFVVPKELAPAFRRQPLVLANGSRPQGGGEVRGGWNDVTQFVLGL